MSVPDKILAAAAAKGVEYVIENFPGWCRTASREEKKLIAEEAKLGALHRARNRAMRAAARTGM